MESEVESPRAPTKLRVRPVVTESGKKQHPARALLTALTKGGQKLEGSRPKREFDAAAERIALLEAERQPQGPQIRGMMVESREFVPPDEARLVVGLTSSFEAAKDQQADVPVAYQPGADWRTLLDKEWAGFREVLQSRDGDGAAAFLRNFFRNEALTGFWGGHEMFRTFASLDGMKSLRRADLMRRQLAAWERESRKPDVAELAAPNIGNPWGYVVGDHVLYEPVVEYNWQAHHLSHLLAGRERPVVLEIGGGFGGLAYQLLNRRDGLKYLGFDLPENVLLQSYYLSCAFPQLRIKSYDSYGEDIDEDTLSRYDIVLMPNFMLPRVAAGLVDLTVNVRSLSEMPAVTVAEYMTHIDRITGTYFFHENLSDRRLDALHGIPSREFPPLANFTELCSHESRWPRYKLDTVYPCRENLFMRS